MNKGDAKVAGIGYGMNRDCLPVDYDRTLVRLIDAPQYLHQRRLAGAVFANQRHHLAGIDLEINVVEGNDTWEPLADSLHLENRSEERRVGKECRSRWSPYH